MIQVYKLFVRRNGMLRSLMYQPHMMWYPEDGTLVRPALTGSLFFGYRSLDEAQTSNFHCGPEVWMCQTSGPIIIQPGMVGGLLDDSDKMAQFWAKPGTVSSSPHQSAMFPDVRLIKRIS